MHKAISLLILLLLITSILVAQEVIEKPQIGKNKSGNNTTIVPRADSLKGEDATIIKIEKGAVDKVVEIDPSLKDSLREEKIRSILDPESKKAPLKAVLFSIIPGGGQAFNRKFWKLPIVYTGMGVAGYFVVKNTREHRQYKIAFQHRVDADSLMTIDSFPQYDVAGLEALRNNNRKDLEIAYFAMVGVYLLSGIEAFVDSHLKTFDISDDLSMRIAPKLLLQHGIRQPGIGVGVTFIPRVNSP